MKKKEVPQDDANMLEGKTRELQYAVDEKGNYTIVKSVGWEPKNIVLQQTWEEIHENLAQVRKSVKEGKYSPLYYHMKKHLLNKRMLAKYAEVSVFKVWLHLKPGRFAKLDEKYINKYKDALNMKPEEDLGEVDG